MGNFNLRELKLKS